MTRQITYIRKRGGAYNPHERIEGVGGGGLLGWYDAEDVAIRNVEHDPRSYFVSVAGRSVWVVVASRNGRKYLKTTDDGYQPDNLLALPNYS